MALAAISADQIGRAVIDAHAHLPSLGERWDMYVRQLGSNQVYSNV